MSQPPTRAGDGDASVVEMRENGRDWEEIAQSLDITVDEALQRYRDEAYEYWDTGWQLTPKNEGLGFFESGALRWESTDSPDVTVGVEEVNTGGVPLAIRLDDPDANATVDAFLSADECRQLANVLNECANILDDMEGDDD